MRTAVIFESTTFASTRDDAVEPAAWLRWLASGGLVATLSYVALIAVPSSAAGLAAFLAFVFAASLGIGSIAIWRFLEGAGGRSPLPMFAAVSNVMAGALFLAMATVQLAVKDVQDPPDEGLRAVYWGLDVAWDMYIGAGTIGFGLALLFFGSIRPWGILGIVVGAALLALNVASFPEPPASAGLVDVGPLVGLWYTGITIWAFLRLRRTTATAMRPGDT